MELVMTLTTIFRMKESFMRITMKVKKIALAMDFLVMPTADLYTHLVMSYTSSKSVWCPPHLCVAYRHLQICRFTKPIFTKPILHFNYFCNGEQLEL